MDFYSNSPKVFTSTPMKGRQNPFENENTYNRNGVTETHFEWKDGCDGDFIIRKILDEMLDAIITKDSAGVDWTEFASGASDAHDDRRYDDRKNPFMDEVYDDSLLEK